MKIYAIGRLIGAVLLAGGIVAVVMFRREPVEPMEPVPARPLKTMVVGQEIAATRAEYPARVDAGEQVAMSFEAGGSLIQLPVKEGDRVRQGQVLAQLDPRDAQNQLDGAEAELQRAHAQLERMRMAAEAKAVSLQELSNAEASYNVALAQRNIRAKALEDTELKASFDGIIAQVLVKNFETVQPRQRILTLQDLTGIEITASIPESKVARLRPRDGVDGGSRFHFSAKFEFLPNREFDIAFKEFSVLADALTQTFTARFTMPNPADVVILPGMTVTVIAKAKDETVAAETTGFEVPLDAIPVDGTGQYYVWRLEPVDGTLFKTVRRNVTLGPLAGANARVVSGLAPGDRIALAGVHVLHEDTIVRLLDEPGSSAP